MWKTVVDDSRYEVNEIGQVKNIETGNILSGSVDAKGYLRYCHLRGTHFAHRIVARAFIPNPDNLPEINHIDFNRLNNHIDNLEWCDRTYNVRYSTVANRYPKQYRPVVMCDKNGNELKRFDGAKVAYEHLGKRSINGSITLCCQGQAKTAYGYKWKYA